MQIVQGPPYSQKDFGNLLHLLYEILTQIKKKGLLSIDSDIDNPDSSALFTKYPSILSNTEIITFITDYLRLISLGVENSDQLEEIINIELESLEKGNSDVVNAIHNIGECMPALGIVVSILGVVHSMSHLDSPPEILGGYIGAALTGTLIGIFLSYCIIGPIANICDKYYKYRLSFNECIQTCLISFLKE